MSGFRAVVKIGTKRWSRIPSLLRNGTEASVLGSSLVVTNRHLQPPCHVTTASFSSKDKSEVKTAPIADSDSELSPIHNRDTHASDNQESSSVKGYKNEEINFDPFEDMFPTKQTIPKSNFARKYDNLLSEWFQKMKLLENTNLPVVLDDIVSDMFPEVAEYSLTPFSPSDARHKCLILLLSKDSDIHLTEKILTQTVKDVSFLPIKLVADIVLSLSTSFQTPLRKETRMKLIQAVVNSRWYDITPKHAVFFMYQVDELFDMRKISYHLRQITKVGSDSVKSKSEGESSSLDDSETPMTDDSKPLPTDKKSLPIISINLEARAVALADELKIKDLARIVILLGKWRNRNQTLLSAVIHRLCQADLSSFNFVQLNNLLFACSVLNIHNSDFLESLTSCLRHATPTSPSLACAVITSLSHLRWKDADLTTKYVSYVGENIGELSPKDALNVLMSLANLHHVPDNDKELDIVKALTEKALGPDVSHTDRIQVGWCLAILLCLDVKLAESLLQPDFVQQFSDAKDPHKKIHFHRLCSISTCARYEVANYSGPLMSEELVTATETKPAPRDSSLNAALNDALRKFADVETYTKLNQSLSAAIFADAVMCANSEGEVRPLAQVEKEEKENLHKLALQVVPFTGVLSPCQSPAGSYQMSARHLRHLGYVPVQILYSELRTSQSVLEKINSIKRKIKSGVSESKT